MPKKLKLSAEEREQHGWMSATGMKMGGFSPEMIAYFKQNGSEGGKASAARLTKAQRVERAKRAINARWARYNQPNPKGTR